MNYLSLRYFNAAGASLERGETHHNETHLIPRVLQATSAQAPHVEVFGSDYPTSDGTCVRDYVHVLDIADAHLRALEAIDRVAGSSFNVETGMGHSILDVVEASRRVTGREISPRAAQRRPRDLAVLLASGEKLRRELGWQPSHSFLEEIIASAWAWMQKHSYG